MIYTSGIYLWVSDGETQYPHSEFLTGQRGSEKESKEHPCKSVRSRTGSDRPVRHGAAVTWRRVQSFNSEALFHIRELFPHLFQQFTVYWVVFLIRMTFEKHPHWWLPKVSCVTIVPPIVTAADEMSCSFLITTESDITGSDVIRELIQMIWNTRGEMWRGLKDKLDDNKKNQSTQVY